MEEREKADLEEILDASLKYIKNESGKRYLIPIASSCDTPYMEIVCRLFYRVYYVVAERHRTFKIKRAMKTDFTNQNA